MGKIYPAIDEELTRFIGAQRMFFVATAPLAEDGHVNVSPKGLDSLRVLGPQRVAYADLTGSGVETIAHLRENGRIALMFCAFEGAPKILRLYGVGRVQARGTPAFDELRPAFPPFGGVRAIIDVQVTRVADSCGFGVPLFEHKGERDALTKMAAAKGEDALAAYRHNKNASSIDGLPGL